MKWDRYSGWISSPEGYKVTLFTVSGGLRYVAYGPKKDLYGFGRVDQTLSKPLTSSKDCRVICEKHYKESINE